ncbi:MAG: hypothetical protein C0501_16580 [Isosphaera sp.]|nr:hypothetical protein [Isosphaera sp.]
MATPISSVTVAPPPAPGAGATAPAAPADDAFANLFRSAVATLTGEVTPARDAAVAAAGEFEPGAGLVDPVVVPDLVADAAVTGLIGLAIPTSFADPAAAVAAEGAPEAIAVGVPVEDAASRTQELRFGFAGGPAPTRGLTVTNLPTPPDNPDPTPPVAATPAVPEAPAEAVPAPVVPRTAPTADPNRLATLVANRLIPAQVPVESVPNPTVPAGGVLVDPTTVNPVSAVGGTAAAPPVSAASGDRPATAGDSFAAVAEAGARLAATSAPPPDAPAAFAATLATQAPDAAPVAPAATGPVVPADVPAPSLLTDVTRPAGNPAPVTVPGAAPVATPEAVAAPGQVRDTATTTARTKPAPVAEPPAEAAPDDAAAPAFLLKPAVTAAPNQPVVTAPTPAPVEPPAAAVRVKAAPEAEPKPDLPTPVAAAAAPPAAPLAAPSSAPAAPAAIAPTPAAQIAGEITVQARTLDRDGTVEFRMQLDPPELGRVRVSLVSAGDEVRGQIVVADDAVRRVVEGQLPELRQRLEAAGVTVQGFDVTTADPGPGGSGAGYREAAEDVPVGRAAPGRPGPAPARAAAGGLDVLA